MHLNLQGLKKEYKEKSVLFRAVQFEERDAFSITGRDSFWQVFSPMDAVKFVCQYNGFKVPSQGFHTGKKIIDPFWHHSSDYMCWIQARTSCEGGPAITYFVQNLDTQIKTRIGCPDTAEYYKTRRPLVELRYRSSGKETLANTPVNLKKHDVWVYKMHFHGKSGSCLVEVVNQLQQLILQNLNSKRYCAVDEIWADKELSK